MLSAVGTASGGLGQRGRDRTKWESQKGDRDRAKEEKGWKRTTEKG